MAEQELCQQVQAVQGETMLAAEEVELVEHCSSAVVEVVVTSLASSAVEEEAPMEYSVREVEVGQGRDLEAVVAPLKVRDCL